jgi:hypothetical protein
MTSTLKEALTGPDKDLHFLRIVDKLTRMDLWAEAEGAEGLTIRRWVRDQFKIETLMEGVRRSARENPEKWGELCVRIEVSYKNFLDRGL